MIGVVVIEVGPAAEAPVEATWLAQHVTSRMHVYGDDVIDALRTMADSLEAAEERRAQLPD